MNVLLVGWLCVLSIAVVGVNSRLLLLRRERESPLARLIAGESPSVAPSSGTPREFILLVTTTCASCDQAIEQFTRLAERHRETQASFVVLTASTDDKRVAPPLILRRDDELYRSIYRGAAPYLFMRSTSDVVSALGVPDSEALLDDLVVRALASPALSVGRTVQ